MTAHAYLPHSDDPYSPNELMLEVSVVGDMTCIQIVRLTEDNSTSSYVAIEGSDFAVSTGALIRALQAGMEQDVLYERQKMRGGHDMNIWRDDERLKKEAAK